MSLTPVNLPLLNTVFAHLAIRGIPYRLGGKIPLDVETDDPRIAGGVDCSGFVRYALSKATGGKMDIGDGSVGQHAWCKEAGLHRLSAYSHVLEADPSRLFIAFIQPAPVGHVWLIQRAQAVDSNWREEQPSTLESCGGRGVSSRPWSTRVLLTNVSECFELPTS